MVIRNRPRYRVGRFLILLVFSIGAGIAGYTIGMAKGGFHFTDTVESNTVLPVEVAQLRELELDARQKMINLERGRQMDQQALMRARDTIAKLESRVSSLSADLSFYKNIMSPTKSYQGLQVDRLELNPVHDNRHFAFKLVLVQVGDNNSYIDGYVSVNIIGKVDGERKAIPLRELSADIDDLDIRFRYRYFQDVEGVLALPQGFDPLSVQTIAESEGGKSARVERTFEWQEQVN